jgi:WD40 repeat protein
LASSCYDGAIRSWDVQTGQQLGALHSRSDRIYALACSPKGAILADGGTDNRIWIWDVQHGRVLQVIRGFSFAVMALTFSPDGVVLVNGCHDGTLRLWDMPTGQCLRVLRVPGPYAGMDITRATGITEAQRVALRALGAVGSE